MRTSILLESPVSLKSSSAQTLKFLALVVVVLLGVQMLAAHPSTVHPASTTTRKTAHMRKHPVISHPTAQQPQATPTTVPLPPELPHWPVNERPTQASVIWDSQGLRINATNSSLQQILTDVSTATGIKVEGLDNDERVFGSYGPGQARDVISGLLHGSGYNVVMIGDQGHGAPRQILLSSRNGKAAPVPVKKSVPNADDDDSDDVEADDTPQQSPPPPPPGLNPGGAQRPQPQQQIQQQQPIQPQDNPQDNPQD